MSTEIIITQQASIVKNTRLSLAKEAFMNELSLLSGSTELLVDLESSDGAFIVFNAKGVQLCKHKKNGELDTAWVSVRPIIVTALVVAYDEPDKVYVELTAVSFGKNDDVMRFIVPFDALTNPGGYRDELAKLRGAGYNLSDKGQTKIALGQALSFAVSSLDDAGQLKKFTFAKKSGWHFPDAVNNPFEKPHHVLSGKDERVASLQTKIFEQSGDKEAYKAFLKQLTIENPNLGLVLGAAVGGFLRGFVTIDTSRIYHFYDNQNSSKGKSLALKVASSMISKGGAGANTLTSWNASTVGIENILTSSNHAYICLDEFHELQGDSDKKTGVIMSIANSISATRATKTGGLRDRKTWDLSILSSGNISISDVVEGNAQEKASKARIFEICVEDHPIWTFSDGSKASAIEHFFAKNYGHLYDEIVKTVAENNAELVAVYESVMKTIEDLARSKKVEEVEWLVRKLKAAGLAFAGIATLENILESDLTQTKQTLLSICNKMIEDEMPNQSAEESKYDSILVWISQNLKHVAFKNFMYTDKSDHEISHEKMQSDQAARHYDLAVRSGIAAVFEQVRPFENEHDFCGTLYIMNSADKITKNFTGPGSLDAIKADLKRLNAGTELKRTHKTVGRCKVVKIGDF